MLLSLSTSVCCMTEQVTNDNNDQKLPHSSALCQLYNIGSVVTVDLHLTLAPCDIRWYLFSVFALIQWCMLYCTHLLVYLENHIPLRAVIQMSAVHSSWLLLLNFLSFCLHITPVYHEILPFIWHRNTEIACWSGDGRQGMMLNKCIWFSYKLFKKCQVK